MNLIFIYLTSSCSSKSVKQIVQPWRQQPVSNQSVNGCTKEVSA